MTVLFECLTVLLKSIDLFDMNDNTQNKFLRNSSKIGDALTLYSFPSPAYVHKRNKLGTKK